jgi:hypothetical protein
MAAAEMAAANVVAVEVTTLDVATAAEEETAADERRHTVIRIYITWIVVIRVYLGRATFNHRFIPIGIVRIDVARSVVGLISIRRAWRHHRSSWRD